MRVRFWGVRGSIPTPISPSQVLGKISAAISRIAPQDLASPEARDAFLSTLPADIAGTVGGDTTCVEVRLSDDTIVIIDAGSGITKLGKMLKDRREHKRIYHIFFTHFHWDHIQGLPFFAPQVYDPDCSVTFYSPRPEMERVLRSQMSSPYFPITLDEMKAKIRFVTLESGPLKLGSAKIFWQKMKHPGSSFAYKIVEGSRSFIFSTDTELTEKDFKKTVSNRTFFQKTDLLVMDAQYTLNESIEKYDWGHSSYSIAVDFAAAWDVSKLVLFHHDPLYDDNKMFSILKSAQWYLRHLQHPKLSIHLAMEEAEFEV